MPVVGELQRETSVIRRFDDDDVGHEVRTEQQAERANLAGLFRHAARQRENGKLLFGRQHDELGTEHDASDVTLVVVHLHRRVVWRSVRHNARRITRSKLNTTIISTLTKNICEIRKKNREKKKSKILVSRAIVRR